jgi:hypothetical protein
MTKANMNSVTTVNKFTYKFIKKKKKKKHGITEETKHWQLCKFTGLAE